MIIESGNVKFIHDLKRKENSIPIKKLYIKTAIFSLILCIVLFVVLVGGMSLLEDWMKTLSEVAQALLGIGAAVVTIIIIGLGIFTFMHKVWGSPEQMDMDNMLSHMENAKFNLGWFNDELVLRRECKNGNISYDNPTKVLKDMFYPIKRIEINDDVVSGKPVRMEVEINFDEKYIIATVLNT